MGARKVDKIYRFLAELEIQENQAEGGSKGYVSVGECERGYGLLQTVFRTLQQGKRQLGGQK
jgi:hypothetical protein